jgi:hypothetical protein
MRLLRPIPLGFLSLLYASVVAIDGWYSTAFGVSLFCSGGRLQGANVERGVAVAFFAGIVGAALLALLRKRRALVLATLLLAIAALALAIGLVALDSATYIQREASCTFGGGGTTTAHVPGLYWAWGFAIALLAVQAVRVLRQPPPEPPKSRYEQPGWLQVPPDVRRDLEGGRER